MQNSVDIMHGNTHVYKCLARSYHLTLEYIDSLCCRQWINSLNLINHDVCAEIQYDVRPNIILCYWQCILLNNVNISAAANSSGII